MSAQIVMLRTNKVIDYVSFDEAYKNAQFDETMWPCNVMDENGALIAHFDDGGDEHDDEPDNQDYQE